LGPAFPALGLGGLRARAAGRERGRRRRATQEGWEGNQATPFRRTVTAMKMLMRTAGLVAVGACALAIYATPALANGSEFEATRLPESNQCSEATPCATKGRAPEGEHSQVLNFGAFTIECNATTKAKTVGEGAITWEFNPTFATEIKFTKCLTKAKFGNFTGGISTNFNGGLPMKILYHINGFAQIGTGETFTEVEVGGGEASLKISGKICKINWPAQTVPAAAIKKPEEEYSSAVYSNKEVTVAKSQKFPEGIQKKLIIANEFKRMKWSYESGQCVGEGGFEEEAKVTEGTSGKWTGILEEEVTGGNLSFVE
jgi:hypothetical protein